MQTQEYLIKLQMLEQEANQYGEQIVMIDQQINELKILENNITKFEESEKEEIYSEFGKGIYFKAKLDKKEFLVDVGSKILVPKTIVEIKGIIDEQIKKFESIKPEIEDRIQEINSELDKIIGEARSEETNEKSPDKANIVKKKK
jgi:prefoldin alpha subunit